MKNNSQKVDKTSVFPFNIKAVDETGKFEGYASTFGNKDQQGDVVVKGAFQKTIAIRKGKWPILWQHDYAEPVGVNVAAEEDEKGLKVTGEMNIASPDGKKAYEWMKFAMEKGLEVGLSIGFRIKDFAREEGTRYLKEIALVEYSIVTFPANEEAGLTAVKSAVEEKIFKAMDFNEALQQEMTERQLYDLRWTIESAKCDATCSVQDDDTMTLDQKVTLLGTIYDQYKTAMLGWWAKWLAFMDASPDAEALDASADDETNEEKAGASISAKTKKILANATDLHDQATQMHKSANKLYAKGTTMISGLIGQAAQTDAGKGTKPPAVAPVPAPNPEPASRDLAEKADADAKAWVDAVSKLHAIVVAK